MKSEHHSLIILFSCLSMLLISESLQTIVTMDEKCLQEMPADCQIDDLGAFELPCDEDEESLARTMAVRIEKSKRKAAPNADDIVERTLNKKRTKPCDIKTCTLHCELQHDLIKSELEYSLVRKEIAKYELEKLKLQVVKLKLQKENEQ